MDRANYFRAAGENVLMLCKHRAFPPDGEPSPAAPDSQALQRQLAENQRIVGNLVEELSSCSESLSAIFRYGGRQSQIGDLPAFAHRLLVDLLHITERRLVRFAAGAPGRSAAGGAGRVRTGAQPGLAGHSRTGAKKRPGRIGSRSLALRGVVR